MSSYAMQITDVSLLLRKIVVGVLVAAIPLLIIIGSLWLTQNLLDRSHSRATTTSEHSNP